MFIGLALILPVPFAVGALLPGAYTWGFSQWAVLPKFLWISVLLLYWLTTLYLLSARSRLYLTNAADTAKARTLSPVLWIVILAVGGVLFFVFRSRAYFYGDGYQILGWSHQRVFSPLIGSELHEPLSTILYRTATALLSPLFAGESELPCAIASVIGGTIALAGLLRFCWLAAEDLKVRLFILFTALTSACTLLLFGWVEHYTWSLAALLWTIAFTAQYFQTHKRLWLPVLTGMVAAAFHLLLAPIPLLVLVIAFPRKRRLPHTSLWLNMLIVASSIVAALVVTEVAPMISIVPLLPSKINPYWALSLEHLRDIFNLVLLVAPLGSVFVLLLFTRKKDLFQSELVQFLGSLTLTIFLISFWIDPVLGAPRDWDVLSMFGLPLSLLGALAIDAKLKHGISVHSLVPVVFLAAILIAPNVYEKHNENIALARLDGLIWQDPHYQVGYQKAFRCISWGTCLEEHTDRPDMAEKYFRRRMEADSSCDICWFNLGEISVKRGDLDSAVVRLGTALRMSPTTPVYLALYAKALQDAKQEDKLRPLLPQLAGLETTNLKALTAVAVVLGNKGDLTASLRASRLAFRISPWDYVVNENLGLVFSRLGPPDSAIYYLNRCIPKEPNTRREQLLGLLLLEQLKGGHGEDAQSTLAEFALQFPKSASLERLKALVNRPR
jgi:tetratricopeptide (TPR) repeat protein